MTNPKAVVPHIEELILLSERDKFGRLPSEDAKRLQQIRNELTRYFCRIEEEIANLRRKLE